MKAATLNYSSAYGAGQPYASQSVTSRPATSAVPMLLLACLAGTGGVSDAHYWNQRQIGYRPPSIRVHARAAAAPDNAAAPADQLSLVRETLKPAMTDLAAVFGVTRQAIYSWINGAKHPSPEHAAKLDDLANAARRLASAGLSGSQVSKRKVADGKTLLQIAQAGGSVSQAADKLITILKTEADQRARLAARLGARKPAVASAEDIGSPMLNEQA